MTFPLTERERKIARLIARGRTNKQIAAELELTADIVKNETALIYRKLNVRSRVDLVLKLARDGEPPA